MTRLIYSAIASRDGFVEDPQGGFDWGAPDAEVLAFINDLERPIGTYLYGRGMYETMRYWETAPTLPDQSPAVRAFRQIWQGADKIVYSHTLETVASARTRIERRFHPPAVRALKQAAEADMTVGGAGLAGQAIAAGLVDELQLFTVPVLVGGGKRSLPEGVRVGLHLLDTRRFTNGVVFSRYGLEP